MKKLTAVLILILTLVPLTTMGEAAMIDVPAISARNVKTISDFPVQIVNESDYLMSVALIYFDCVQRVLRCEGWWNVEPHKARQFSLRHLKGRPIFYYVECQGKAYSKLKSDGGLDWRVSKIQFSYSKGDTVKMVDPYKVHFVRGGSTKAGWWQLTIK